MSQETEFTGIVLESYTQIVDELDDSSSVIVSEGDQSSSVSLVKFHKVVASLPENIDPNSIYFIRTGTGFDLYASDATGQVAHKLNIPETGLKEIELLEGYLRGKDKASETINTST